MKITDLSLRATVRTVQLGGRSYRVLRPETALRGWLVDEQVCWSTFQGQLDKWSIRALTVAWAFAARSPRTITYLPITPPTAPHGTHRPDSTAPTLDLVLVHHSLQFRASTWKALRARLGPGHPQTIALPASAFPEYFEDDWRRTYYLEDRNPLRVDVAADTLFVTGSRSGFQREIDVLRGLVEECPAHQASIFDTHCCGELAERRIHLDYWNEKPRRTENEYSYAP